MKTDSSSKGWPEGWLVAAAAAVFVVVMVTMVGDGVGLFATIMIAIFVFLVFGVLLGMFWGVPVVTSSGHGAAAHGAPEHGSDAPHRHASHAPAPAPVSVVPVAQDVAEPPLAPVAFAQMPVAGSAPMPAIEQPAEAVATDEGMALAPIAAPVADPVGADTPLSSPAELSAPVGGSIRPAGLAAPRGGTPDRLQTIEGIGPVLEKLCHDLGIYHFDQIAGWGPAEIAWMDGNLKGFKGRVSRDKWVRQAALIGEVGVDEFLRRAKSNAY